MRYILPIVLMIIAGCQEARNPVAASKKALVDSTEYWAKENGLPSTDYVLKYSDLTHKYRIYWRDFELKSLWVVELNANYGFAALGSGEIANDGYIADFTTKSEAIEAANKHYAEVVRARGNVEHEEKERTSFKLVKTR